MLVKLCALDSVTEFRHDTCRC